MAGVFMFSTCTVGQRALPSFRDGWLTWVTHVG
jgi:hypothetical protein